MQPKLKREAREWIEDTLECEPGFEIALAKIDKRPGLTICNLCSKSFNNRYDLEVHMRYDEKKKHFKSQTNILTVSSATEEEKHSEYMTSLTNILHKLVDANERPAPNVTQITKARSPPAWSNESFESYKEQLLN